MAHSAGMLEECGTKARSQLRSGGATKAGSFWQCMVLLIWKRNFQWGPKRTFDRFIDDAIGLWNKYLTQGIAINISAGDFTPNCDQRRCEAAKRWTEIRVAVSLNHRKSAPT